MNNISAGADENKQYYQNDRQMQYIKKPYYSRNKNYRHYPQKFLNEELAEDFMVSAAKFGKAHYEPSPVAEVVFQCKRKKLYANTNKYPLRTCEYVVVQVENGIDIGTIGAYGADALEKQKTLYKNEIPEFTILRHANRDDLERYKNNIHDEQNVIEKVKDIAKETNLDMKVTDAEWQFDKQKLTVYFTAPHRVDFRDLVKELARIFKTRIELRQISTREEAKRIGGMGPCGLNLCCSCFVNEFSHVTLDHAKTQMLSSNVAKLSGYCGRLKCCLLYEHDSYLEEFKNYPPLASTVELPDGIAKIAKIDIFKKIIYLHFDKTQSYRSISYSDIVELMGQGKVTFPEIEEIEKFTDEEFGFDEYQYYEEEIY